jgi:SAM-dependent methyltransferase
MTKDKAGGYASYAFIADFYDHVVPYRERQDISFFAEEAIASNGPVLEVGCGTGRVLIPTARAGVTISGVDLSTHMLNVCSERLAQEPREVQARVRLFEADMRDFDLGEEFALITVPFRPFQHLTTVSEQLSCLRTIHRHLLAGGRLILDLFNPKIEALVSQEIGPEFGDEPAFTMPDGRRVTRRHKITGWDRFNQVRDTELIYYVTHPDGREERLVQPFAMRYLFRFEAEHLLARCGFELEQVYSDYDRSSYGSKYPGELIMMARKPV